MASMYGNKLKISIFGQSHSPAIGVTVDGLPAGFPIAMDKLQPRWASPQGWATPCLTGWKAESPPFCLPFLR